MSLKWKEVFLWVNHLPFKYDQISIPCKPGMLVHICNHNTIVVKRKTDKESPRAHGLASLLSTALNKKETHTVSSKVENKH